MKVNWKNKNIHFYFGNEYIRDFTQIWTNRIVFERILSKEVVKQIYIFIIRPGLGDNPFDIIKDKVIGKNYKIILWYVDVADNVFNDKSFYHKETKNLVNSGEEVLVVSPEVYLNIKLPYKVINTYSMADSVLEQQRIDIKILTYLFKQNERRSFVRQKHFLSFNGHPKGHRIVLLAHILNNNLFEKFDISFNSFFWNEDVNFEHLDEYNFEKFDTSILPLDLDLKKTTPYTSTFLNIVLYFHSYIDVITNSRFENDGIYIDEKIYKSFACLKPFIVVGQYKTLEVLKKWGFKTFSSIFNEEYDNERNDVKRMNMICDEIKRLGNLSLEEVDDMYWNIKDILLYNFSHLGRFIHEIDKNLLKEVVK